MFGWLTGASLSFKILLVLGVAAIIAAASAKFTHDYVATSYQNIALAKENAIVVRERKIEVLDKKTLEAAVAPLKRQLQRAQEEREVLNEIIRNHSDRPWTELSPYELCVWNAGNRLVIPDDSSILTECGGELQRTSKGEERGTIKPVGK